MKKISILGSGWLGLPLSKHFVEKGCHVNASTRTKKRTEEIINVGADPFIVDIESLADDIKSFLEAEILIVNITSKDIASYENLIARILTSGIKYVLYISSTSVYESTNETATESKGKLSLKSPIRMIEDRFRSCDAFQTTILRFAGLIGYSRHPGRFFRSSKTVRYPDSPVNLIHRDDCIGIIDQIIQQNAWGKVFNGCADTHPTKREFYSHAAEAIGENPPEFSANDPLSFKLVSNLKVKQELNYHFKYPNLMEIELNDGSF